ncbi:hypothetical protein A2130_01285 [Candidatus Woesebacteria bacterium GWC2_33_12]|uniref:Uncharacterized protein n=1 Tax=Candidatus Woesebacteria bacterium GW2011_GWB1_33_22 TaxID=1618566 RepID=A0A0F9ZZ37_9BACT|nr:MAG: hypothetical protein UR29_C0012G0002 [Candidatus Woesebacteria bacterium GW2011_GWC2_33_12]KKP41757.1 MAG: hypothetical protein UR33_C0010G0002 [Candidatus Woesebacteria bacterium GW2011_GWA2_33_20]KKP44211.1 MAG: hypothetical protein UR35_C0010G0003 [Candidatus Woesebacteria bacterium GW2011_GWB1_33_22]KKP45917.1 MAG: hypothetical protein UR37_C0013G0003 [Microgenomates group bacterium GW2011_GWC1_33_28]KKP49802.1 MAG: hypothetical protein UR41_C0012G0003 [Candidatus Woesebacteria bact
MTEEPLEVKILGSRKLSPEEVNSILGDKPMEQGETFDIGWIDFVEEQAHSQSRKKDKVAIPGATETFEAGVLENLEQEIKQLAIEEADSKKIYHHLSFRYHPNFYGQKDQETQNLATEYSQALQKMQEVGYLEKLVSTQK